MGLGQQMEPELVWHLDSGCAEPNPKQGALLRTLSVQDRASSSPSLPSEPLLILHLRSATPSGPSHLDLESSGGRVLGVPRRLAFGCRGA